MDNIFKKSIEESMELKKLLLDNSYIENILFIGNLIVSSIINGNKLMFCGNGGSAADAQHLAAELLVRLRPKINRTAIPALSLSLDTSTITACGNDFGFDFLYERNVLALGKKGDVLICLSTSGQSKNIELAAIAAKSIGIITYGMLGNDGGVIKKVCDYSIVVPSRNTARIQECHMVLGHALMEYIEDSLIESSFVKKF
jgi:D-sedoheptulose 7-phosphate isomerase